MPNKKAFETPVLGPNVTPEMIVDELGRLSAIRSYEKKMTEFYKEAFYGRLGGKEQALKDGPIFTGDQWQVTLGAHSRTAFNQSLHAEEQPDCHAKYVTATPVQTMRCAHIVDIEFNKVIDDLRKELGLDD